MFLNVLTLSFLITGAFSAPVPVNGALVQKAFTAIGNKYTILQNAFTELNTNLLQPVYNSRVPSAHADLMTIFQQTGDTLFNSNAPKLGYVEVAALSGAANTLSTTITKTIGVITKAKPIVVRSGEGASVGQMLQIQLTAYQSWAAALGNLTPTGEKTIGSRFTLDVIAAYQKAIKTFA